MKYFVYNQSNFTVAWIIIADDELTEFRTSKANRWETLNDERRDTLLRVWREVPRDEAFLEMI